MDNADKLPNVHKTLEKEAKLEAAQLLREYLQSPEDLNNVEQIKLEAQQERRLVEGSLKNLIKSKLDHVKVGIGDLNELIDGHIPLIRENFENIYLLSKTCEDLIPSYKVVHDVNTARSNLEKTLRSLDAIIEIPNAVRNTRLMMEQDINILDVHKEIKRLEYERRQILSKSGTDEDHQSRKELEEILDDVIELSKDFNERIEHLLNEHFDLANTKPAVLVKVLQVVFRDNKYYEYKLEEGTPEEDLQKLFTIEKSSVILQRAAQRKFDVMFDGRLIDEDGNYDIEEFIRIAKDELFLHIKEVVAYLIPCFPPVFDIFNLYCGAYHAGLLVLFSNLVESKDVAEIDIVDLVFWAETTYLEEMTPNIELYGSEGILSPPLTLPLDPILDRLGESTTKQLEDWIEGLVESDKEANISEDIYYTSSPITLFTMLSEKIEVAFGTNSQILSARTAEICLKCLLFYKDVCMETLDIQWSVYSLKYLIALVNNHDKCIKKLEEFTKRLNKKLIKRIDSSKADHGFVEIIKSCRKYIVQYMINRIHELLSNLFSAEWHADSGTVTTDILNIVCDDLEIAEEHMVEDYMPMLARELLLEIVRGYTYAFFNKTHKEEMGPSTPERLADDVSFLRDCFTDFGVSDRQLDRQLEVFDDLDSLLTNRSVEKLGKIVGGMTEKYPDLTMAHIEYIIATKNLDRKQRTSTISICKEHFEKHKGKTREHSAYEGYFPEITESGSTKFSLPKFV
eukprot:TRINITY_DN5751_c0_g2_i1.p1 TRINITY_DN5751_c0_g2~~TRINITY_DN5751_c0_g2_i1.p1  ORF type:complete len:738 (-),score=184.07 TRINITY_DN5751_c0_g2_i1:15-2228(-)